MKRRYFLLATGTLLLLCLGLIYSYSVLMAPLKAQFEWSVSGCTLIFAFSMIAFTIGNLSAGRLLRNHSVAFVFRLAVAFLLVGFIGSSFADGAMSLPVIYACYGIIASIGIGLAYNVVVPTITSWFPDKTGLAQGVCLMGYGFGGFLLGPVVTKLYASVDWRMVFVATGIVFSVLTLLVSIIVRTPSEAEAAELPQPVAGPQSAEAVVVDADTSHMMRDRSFWLLYLFLFMLGGVGMGITGIGKEFPTSLGADPITATFVIGFVNIGSGIGRLCGGAVLDRVGRDKTMVGIACLFFVSVLTMIGSVVTRSIPIMIAGCLLVGISWGSTIVSMPFVTRKKWGQKYMAENLAVVNSYSVFAAVVGSWGAGLLADAAGSYLVVLVIMVVMTLLGAVVALVFNRHEARAIECASARV